MYAKQIYDVANLSDVEVYLLVKDGSLGKFPNGFLNKSSCRQIFRWLCLKKYQLTREDVCRLRKDFLVSNNITSFQRFFHYGMSDLILFSFPEWDIKYWELSKVPINFWKDTANQKAFVEWVAQKANLDLNNLEDVSKMNSYFFIKHGGSRAIQAAGGAFNLITTVTGDKFKEWEVLKLDRWTDEKALGAIKWLIEERLKWSDVQIANHLTASVFQENNLQGLLKKRFNSSPIRALEFAYPGKFKSIKRCKR